MYYMHSGKIYAPRMKNGAPVYDLMRVRPGRDGAPCIVRAGGIVKALPSGALPMTSGEVLARFPCELANRESEAAEDVPDPR